MEQYYKEQYYRKNGFVAYVMQFEELPATYWII